MHLIGILSPSVKRTVTNSLYFSLNKAEQKTATLFEIFNFFKQMFNGIMNFIYPVLSWCEDLLWSGSTLNMGINTKAVALLLYNTVPMI